MHARPHHTLSTNTLIILWYMKWYCVCLCVSHGQDPVSIAAAAAGPPASDHPLLEQRHLSIDLLQQLQVTFLWRLGRTQHVVQLHCQVT